VVKFWRSISRDHLRRGHGERGTDLSSLLSRHRASARDGVKLPQGKFSLDAREKLLTESGLAQERVRCTLPQVRCHSPRPAGVQEVFGDTYTWFNFHVALCGVRSKPRGSSQAPSSSGQPSVSGSFSILLDHLTPASLLPQSGRTKAPSPREDPPQPGGPSPLSCRVGLLVPGALANHSRWQRHLTRVTHCASTSPPTASLSLSRHTVRQIYFQLLALSPPLAGCPAAGGGISSSPHHASVGGREGSPGAPRCPRNRRQRPPHPPDLCRPQAAGRGGATGPVLTGAEVAS